MRTRFLISMMILVMSIPLAIPVSTAKAIYAPLQGFVDGVDCNYISGWAWDAAQPNSPINVMIYDGDNQLALVPANIFRQDLVNAGIGNGYHGYRYPLPPTLKDGLTHSISVKYSGTSTHLSNSPKAIACANPYQGYFDGVDCNNLWGWAWDNTQPNTPINVNILYDGSLFATIKADKFRPDLANAGIGNGYHAFSFPLPNNLKNGRPHSISVQITETFANLNYSPRSITCANPLAESDINAKYASLGGSAGSLGPATIPITLAPDGVGYYQHYQNGSIYWSPATRAHEVHGLIRQRWAELGWESSFLGYPLTDETATSGGVGRYNHFQGGSIYWSPSTGAYEVHGLIRSKWISLGAESSFLGYPLTDETPTPDGIGRYNHFQGGSIYWSPSTGAREVHGLIREKWASLGWERSFLGYPTTDELPIPGFSGFGRFNRFESGSIYYGPSSGAVAIKDLAGDIFTHKVNQTTGTRRVIAILWDPHRPGHPAPSVSDLDRMLFGPNPSVSDWYRENSNGKMTLQRAGVLGWYDADKPADHYWNENQTSDTDGDGWLNGHVEKWAEAIRKADRDFDFAAFDTNHDGVLSPDELGILIVIPQNGPFGTNRGPAGREAPTWQPLIVDGVRIPVIAETYLGNPINLGVQAHELSHLFMGTPDLYMNGMAWPYVSHTYSIMDSTYTTSHFDPFCKLKAGWLSYAVAIESGEYTIKDIETRGEALVLYNPTKGPGEYFLIENRWRGTSYDAGVAGVGGGIPSDGIAIWHIIEDPALMSMSTPPIGGWGRSSILLVRANGGTPDDDTRALFNSAGATISDDTAPANLRWIDGTRSGFQVDMLTSSGPDVRVRVTIRR